MGRFGSKEKAPEDDVSTPVVPLRQDLLQDGREEPTESLPQEIRNLAYVLCRDFERYRKRSWTRMLQAEFLSNIPYGGDRFVINSEIMNIYISILESIYQRYSSEKVQDDLALLRDRVELLRPIYKTYLILWKAVEEARTKGKFVIPPDVRGAYSRPFDIHEMQPMELIARIQLNRTILEEPVWGLWECLGYIHDILFEENEDEAESALNGLLGRLPHLIYVARTSSNIPYIDQDSLARSWDLIPTNDDIVSLDGAQRLSTISQWPESRSILKNYSDLPLSSVRQKGVTFGGDNTEGSRLKKRAVPKRTYTKELTNLYENPRTVIPISPFLSRKNSPSEGNDDESEPDDNQNYSTLRKRRRFI